MLDYLRKQQRKWWLKKVSATALHIQTLDSNAASAAIQDILQGPAASLLPDVWLLAANVVTPSPTEKFSFLNRCLSGYGLPTITQKDAKLPPNVFNIEANLTMVKHKPGPLVTVLMTTFNSSAWVDVAIESVLQQSWENLELLVVDDASTDSTVNKVAAWASQDARLRLIRLPRNTGTYAAKHIGLQHASGEFITCQDSDDWAHPLKIERQIEPLLKKRQAVASISCWVRVSERGHFHARQGYPLVRWNPSSTLFRRDLVLARMGAWDVVRTGADSEFLARIKAVFGPDAVVRLSEPLSVGSHRDGSLMTDPATGYNEKGVSASRQAYVTAWQTWHSQAIAIGRPCLPIDPVDVVHQRPYSVPDSIKVDEEDLWFNVMQAGKPTFLKEIEATNVFGTTGWALASIPTLPALLTGKIHGLHRRTEASGFYGVLAWGNKPSAHKAEQLAVKKRLPLLRLEDGFLRSYGTGDGFPPLAIVLDKVGIYYDSTRPSQLERLLNGDMDVLAGLEVDAQSAKQLLLTHRLSKYNHAPMLPDGMLRPGDAKRVLVVDQTAGDMSVALGGASAATFTAMLAAARAENPGATVYVKTHPEVSAGRKGGYLTQVQNDDQTVVLRAPVNPLSLIEQMDRVYVVSSTMGFEALLAGKPVTCFGLPWYAGWGVTDDRQNCPRRTRQRTVDELFAAGYIHYTRYLNPVTHTRGTIFDVIDWLVRQRATMARQHGDNGRGRLLGVGFRRWKAANLQPLLTLDRRRLHWLASVDRVREAKPTPDDSLFFWGATPPKGLAEMARETGAGLMRLEDGFVRSVGLGSDLIPPHSLVLDRRGIYFDPSQPSDLEVLLNEAVFTAEELEEARRVREFVVTHGMTKYNLEPRRQPPWATKGKRVVLVPGQVEDDASIRLGAGKVRTNLALLQAAREACPNAFVVYKPHPDVTSGNRRGRLALQEAMRWADHVETECSVVSCLDACDEVHTITSLTGFDALLRGKKVVVYGQPFYAGWGLTHDITPRHEAVAFQRRQRALTLDELVAGALLRYPLYWDPVLKGYTTCMAVLQQLLAERDRREANGGLQRLRSGWLRRQARKALTLWRAWRTQ